MKPLPNKLTTPFHIRFLQAFVCALLVLLILLPFLSLLRDLFFVNGQFSLQNLEVVLLNSRQGVLLGNSFFIAAGAALVALSLGVPFAWIITRTDVPWHRFFFAVGMIPILIPPMIAAIAWVGILKIQGIIWPPLILGFSYFPFVWLLCARSLQNIDARIEESARLAGGWRAAIRVQIPFVLPAAGIGALLVIVFSIADFALPDFLSSIGKKISVYADDIFFRAKQAEQTGEAVAAAIPPLIIVMTALWLILKLRPRITPSLGAGFEPPKKIKLGPWRALALALVLIVCTLTVFLPLAQLLLEANSLQAYRDALQEAQQDLKNSLFCSTIAAILAGVLHFFPALYTSRRTKTFFMDFFLLLPLAVPALFLSIGLIRIWNHPGPLFNWADLIYGTTAIVIMAFLIRFLAFSYFASVQALRSIDSSLEEAGALCGLSWWTRLRQIILPLAMPAIISGMLVVFLFSMREIDAITLIPSGNPTVMFRIYNYIHFGRDSLIAALCIITVFLIAFPLVIFHLWNPWKGSKSA